MSARWGSIPELYKILQTFRPNGTLQLNIIKFYKDGAPLGLYS